MPSLMCLLPLQGSPQTLRLEVWRSRGLVYLVPGSHKLTLTGLLLALDVGRANPLAADCRGKWFPFVRRGEMQPVGHLSARRGKSVLFLKSQIQTLFLLAYLGMSNLCWLSIKPLDDLAFLTSQR
jgi:hypothetical protein